MKAYREGGVRLGNMFGEGMASPGLALFEGVMSGEDVHIHECTYMHAWLNMSLYIK